MKILIVDDSRAIQAIVRQAVLQSGWDELDVHTADSGSDALERIQANPPDLILTDWHMPGMSGLEMLQLLRQLGHSQLPVGFLTAETEAGLLEEARANGASFILTKPFKDTELHQQLHPVVSEIKARRSQKPLIALEALSSLVRSSLQEFPYRLQNQAMTAQHMTAQNLLALYRQPGSSAITALAVMDQPCATMLGHRNKAEALQTASRLLGQAAELLQGSWSEPLVMHKHSVVNRDFAKLHELFKSNNGFASFRLEMPGHGNGHMAFFAV